MTFTVKNYKKSFPCEQRAIIHRNLKNGESQNHLMHMKKPLQQLLASMTHITTRLKQENSVNKSENNQNKSSIFLHFFVTKLPEEVSNQKIKTYC